MVVVSLTRRVFGLLLKNVDAVCLFRLFYFELVCAIAPAHACINILLLMLRCLGPLRDVCK